MIIEYIFDKIAKDCPARNKHGQCDYMHSLSSDTGDCDYQWCPERLRRDVERHFRLGIEEQEKIDKAYEE